MRTEWICAGIRHHLAWQYTSLRRRRKFV